MIAPTSPAMGGPGVPAAGVIAATVEPDASDLPAPGPADPVCPVAVLAREAEAAIVAQGTAQSGWISGAVAEARMQAAMTRLEAIERAAMACQAASPEGAMFQVLVAYGELVLLECHAATEAFPDVGHALSRVREALGSVARTLADGGVPAGPEACGYYLLPGVMEGIPA